MKIKEAQAKLDELKAVAEPSEEQKKELSTLEGFVVEETKQVTRYTELGAKEEKLLTSEEVDEYLLLAEKFGKIEEKPEEKKKYAGIYETPEALVKGLMSSETERTRIEEEIRKDPELAAVLEEEYKGSQRKVTKAVEVKKGAVKKPDAKKALPERKMHEMTKEEYASWEKEDTLAAHSWLAKAQALHESQAKSGRTVFEKHPEFYTMQQGVIQPSEDFKKFLEIESEHPEWENEPNAAELILAELEKGKEPAKVAPKKDPVKPDFAAGKRTASPQKGKKLSPQEFEALGPEAQREYMEQEVGV